MITLGIDIGGTGIKGSTVDLDKGELTAERFRIPTPHPATPEAVFAVLQQVVDHFAWKGPVGCGFPGVIHGNTVFTAANMDASFIGCDLGQALSGMTGQPAYVVNDADAAGMAEMRYGAGKGFKGVALLVTVGTGLGTALFYQGRLVPNLELGHVLMKHKGNVVDAESLASDSARKREDMGWEKWAKHLGKYLDEAHALVRPELIIIGGGVASRSGKFLKHLKAPCELRIATLENLAGIVGAALAAEGH